jgi:hypothetical protein
MTENGLALYRRVEASCSLGTGSPSEGILKPNWEQDKFVRDFFRTNSLGQKAAFGPLLVISSESDFAVPISLTAEAVDRLCKHGDRVQFYRYQGPNPKAVIGDSVRDQIAWIQERFAGRTAPSNCH